MTSYFTKWKGNFKLSHRFTRMNTDQEIKNLIREDPCESVANYSVAASRASRAAPMGAPSRPSFAATMSVASKHG